jgi:hypothetical protein
MKESLAKKARKNLEPGQYVKLTLGNCSTPKEFINVFKGYKDATKNEYSKSYARAAYGANTKQTLEGEAKLKKVFDILKDKNFKFLSYQPNGQRTNIEDIKTGDIITVPTAHIVPSTKNPQVFNKFFEFNDGISTVTIEFSDDVDVNIKYKKKPKKEK